ncbi:MAG: DNA cytosine methyltransferase [Pseudomonadota bacterium]
MQLSLINSSVEAVLPVRGRKHKVAGLFAGIGGLERGLERAGHEPKLFCENDPAAMAVLANKYPEVKLHDDICTLERVPRGTSLLTAGFPCQDLSQAGRTVGISGARSGLVGEVFRLLEQNRVPSVLLENVPFMLQLGRGSAMDLITTEFERLGYAWAYRVVDARAFGLPQRRRRVYFYASLRDDPRAVLFADDAEETNERALNGCLRERRIDGEPVACGFYWTEGIRGLGWAPDALPTLKSGSAVGIPSPPAMLMPDGNIVTPDIRDAEKLQGFPQDWTKAAERVARRSARWKLVGNAVSVPAAAWLGSRLRDPGKVLDFSLSALKGSPWPTAAWNVGYGRMRVEASEWPDKKPYKSVLKYLKRDPVPLSERAARGFYERLERTNLNLPDGFKAAVKEYLDRITTKTTEHAVSNRRSGSDQQSAFL